MKNKLNLSKEQLGIIDDELKKAYVPEKRTKKKKSLNELAMWSYISEPISFQLPTDSFTISAVDTQSGTLTVASTPSGSTGWYYGMDGFDTSTSNNNGENNNE